MIVSTRLIPSDKKTKRLLVEALKLAIDATDNAKKQKQFNAVLIVLEMEQSELPL